MKSILLMWYKNVRAQNFLILAFSLAGIMGSVYVFNLNWELSPEDKHQIEKEVFSSLVGYLTDHPEADFDYLFLGSSGSDPSPGILNHIQNQSPKVEPISSSKVTYGFSAPVVHKSDLDKRGIQIDLEILGREVNGDIKVRTSVYQDKVASATYLYILNRYNGAYRIVTVVFPDQKMF